MVARDKGGFLRWLSTAKLSTLQGIPKLVHTAFISSEAPKQREDLGTVKRLARKGVIRTGGGYEKGKWGIY